MQSIKKSNEEYFNVCRFTEIYDQCSQKDVQIKINMNVLNLIKCVPNLMPNAISHSVVFSPSAFQFKILFHILPSFA